jgi:hypothetical protein
MDDFNISTLTESRNEYSAMLVSRLTPQIIYGINSIFNDAVKLCHDNDENEKYLMTFQNFLGRIPKWNQEIVNNEVQRIIKNTNCSYLEDLLTCVHITQLKVLTSMRTTNKQRKIDIDIPKLNNFIHKAYIEVGRKIYKNVFLFEQNIYPLQKQKNSRELEIIVKECLLNVIRDNMPIETILKNYLDESIEENVEEIREEIKEHIEEITNPQKDEFNSSLKVQKQEQEEKQDKQHGDDEFSNSNETNIHIDDNDDNDEILSDGNSENKDSSNGKKHIGFNNQDSVVKYKHEEHTRIISDISPEIVNAPKDIKRLEEISDEKWKQRNLEETDDDTNSSNENSERLKIMADVKLDDLDIQTINKDIKLSNIDLLGDVVQLN